MGYQLITIEDRRTNLNNIVESIYSDSKYLKAKGNGFFPWTPCVIVCMINPSLDMLERKISCFVLASSQSNQH